MMNKSTVVGIVAGAIAVTAIGAFATSRLGLMEDQPEAQAKIARQVCRDEQVTRQAPVQDEKRVAGTTIGAVVGGVLGNQVGGGDGKKIATVAGAAAGGYAGNQIQKEMQKGNLETVIEQRCETVYE